MGVDRLEKVLPEGEFAEPAKTSEALFIMGTHTQYEKLFANFLTGHKQKWQKSLVAVNISMMVRMFKWFIR